jgi:glycosyltransferase involved in cell wall biosynthesis
MSRRIDLGVVVPDLRRLGGAERLALACIERWSDRFRTTLYSTGFADEVAARLGGGVALRPLSSRVAPPRGTLERSHASVFNALALPALWGEEMGEHEAYLAHQWPAQRIGRRPLVWYAHEPRRELHDLRYEQGSDELVAWVAEVRDAAGEDWDHVLDRRNRAVQAVLDAAEARDRPERVVTNSRFTAGMIQGILGGPLPDVVHPGVDVAAFADEPAFDEPFFLAIGRLGRHKRPRLLIEALALAPEARLVFAGGGPLAEACAAMARALGVGERVELRGNVSDAELRDLLRRCRGVAFVPLREPFGMVALEAMAAGKPLVCTGEGGYAEVVDEGCALVVPPEPARIAEAFAALVRDPTRARALGEAGRRRARDHGWERTARALGDLVAATARGAAPRRGAPPTAALPAPRPARAANASGATLAVALRLGFGEGPTGRGWAELREAGGGEAPAAGYYASTHGSTIERQHAALAELSPGVVLLGVSVDASGPGLRELAASANHLEIAARDGSPLRFAVQARVASGGEARVGELARLVAADLARHGPYAREGDAPLLFVETLAGADEDAWRESLADAPAVAARRLSPPDVLCVATERGEAPWQAAGARLRAAASAPAWVVLDAWNDFADGRFLEPAHREGRERLDRALAFARELRAPARGARREVAAAGTGRGATLGEEGAP